MSAALTCFLFGIGLTIFWAAGIKRGVMVLVLAPGPGKWTVTRSTKPARFWIETFLAGCLSLAFVISPVLSWLKLRG